MTQDTGRIIVEVRAGNAEQVDVGLTPGEPIEAFSVGQNGSWRIVAPGLADVHAYLYFDGATLFVASVNPSDPAWVNGRPVPTEWQAITPPCEIAMGSARLWAEAEEEFDLEPDEPEPDPRRQDPRAAEQARRDARPKRPHISPPKLDEATAISALHAPVPAPAQSVQVERKRDKVRQIKIRQSVREAPPDEESTRLAPIDVTNAADAPRGPLPAAGRPAQDDLASAGAPVPAPGPPIPGGYPMPAPGAPVPGGYPVPGGPPSGGFVPPGVAPPVSAPFAPPVSAPFAPQGYAGAPFPAPLPPGGTSPPQSFGAAPGIAATTTQPGKKSVGATIVTSWKQASIPQKIILALMPFAIIAMLVIFDDKKKGPPRPAGHKPVASASASAPEPAASAPPSADPSVAATDSAAPSPAPTDADPNLAAAPAHKPPPPPPRRYGKEPPKSVERQAADLVAAGNYAEAAKLYQDLADDHPDMPVYREATRILKDKAAQNRK